MTLIDFKRIKRVIKLDKKVFKEIRDDENALTQGLVLVVLVALITAVAQGAASILQELIQPTIMGLGGAAIVSVIMIVALPILSVIFIFLLAILPHLIAKHGFKGKSTYMGYVKAFCFVEIISLLSIIASLLGVIPIIGSILMLLLSFIFSIIYLVYWVIATRETYEISTVGAIVSVVVPIIIYIGIIIVLVVIAGIIFGLALFNMASQGGFSSY
jgi:hypothetical protein